MAYLKVFQDHVREYDQWYDKHPLVFDSEVLAIKEQMAKLPENIHGVEVGVGTGRFAEALGIKEGVEPSKEMASLASKRGVEIMLKAAENLPYSDVHFDFILFVTICYLKDVPAALSEAYRVLKQGGSLLLAFLDKNSTIVKQYRDKGRASRFYPDARFYGVETVLKWVQEAGFKQPELIQTLFGKLEEITEVQEPMTGSGAGSFVVLRAIRK